MIALGILGFLGGGPRRARYVGGALGIVALMGTRVWQDRVITFTTVLVVLVCVAPFTALAVATLNRAPKRLPTTRRVMLGWSWVHPYALIMPGILAFGIGTAAAIVLTVIAVLPTAIASATAPGGPTAIQASSLGARTIAGLRGAVPPTLLIIVIFSLIGAGGLGATLFRAISTVDLVAGADAALALWLVGLALWSLLGPWSLDHLKRTAEPVHRSDSAPPDAVVAPGDTTLATPTPTKG